VPSTPSLKGDKVDVSDLRNILKNLGLELTEKEQERLLKMLPVDGEPAGRLAKLCFVSLFLSVGLCTSL
jgi:Ca2+-binding EF-hand superfamily protein